MSMKEVRYSIQKALMPIALTLAVSVSCFVGMLSLIFGQFPPPFMKLKAQLSEFQSMARTTSDPATFKKIANHDKDTFKAAEAAAAGDGFETASGSSGSSTSSPAGDFSNDREKLQAEIRMLKYKIQTLEARQQEQDKWLHQVWQKLSATH